MNKSNYKQYLPRKVTVRPYSEIAKEIVLTKKHTNIRNSENSLILPIRVMDRLEGLSDTDLVYVIGINNTYNSPEDMIDRIRYGVLLNNLPVDIKGSITRWDTINHLVLHLEYKLGPQKKKTEVILINPVASNLKLKVQPRFRSLNYVS